MLQDDERHIPVKFCYGGRSQFASGGLAHAANKVADAGRYGDEMVVHINRREFDELRQRWGDPHINPETGLPEFWNLKDLWHNVKDYVGPVGGAVAGAFLPVIGDTIGNYLPGVSSLLGSTGTQALGAGLLGAGLGAISNGGQGALLGGISGALGAYGGDLLKNGTGSSLGAALGGGDTLDGAAAASVLGGDVGGSTNKLGGSGMGSGAFGPALLMAALNIAGQSVGGGASADEKAAKKAEKASQAQFNKPLPTYVNPRKRISYTGVPDYTQEGERSYFANNGFADGGAVGYASGGNTDDGRSDKIEALLSPGEFIFDAETVSLLGNGSTEAGAAQLDQLRQNIRKHKGSALAAGAISPDALPATQYLGGA